VITGLAGWDGQEHRRQRDRPTVIERLGRDSMDAPQIRRVMEEGFS
jgi:hypothetical protein